MNSTEEVKAALDLQKTVPNPNKAVTQPAAAPDANVSLSAAPQVVANPSASPDSFAESFLPNSSHAPASSPSATSVDGSSNEDSTGDTSTSLSQGDGDTASTPVAVTRIVSPPALNLQQFFPDNAPVRPVAQHNDGKAAAESHELLISKPSSPNAKGNLPLKPTPLSPFKAPKPKGSPEKPQQAINGNTNTSANASADTSSSKDTSSGKFVGKLLFSEDTEKVRDEEDKTAADLPKAMNAPLPDHRSPKCKRQLIFGSLTVATRAAAKVIANASVAANASAMAAANAPSTAQVPTFDPLSPSEIAQRCLPKSDFIRDCFKHLPAPELRDEVIATWVELYNFLTSRTFLFKKMGLPHVCETARFELQGHHLTEGKDHVEKAINYGNKLFNLMRELFAAFSLAHFPKHANALKKGKTKSPDGESAVGQHYQAFINYLDENILTRGSMDINNCVNQFYQKHADLNKGFTLPSNLDSDEKVKLDSLQNTIQHFVFHARAYAGLNDCFRESLRTSPQRFYRDIMGNRAGLLKSFYNVGFTNEFIDRKMNYDVFKADIAQQRACIGRSLNPQGKGMYAVTKRPLSPAESKTISDTCQRQFTAESPTRDMFLTEEELSSIATLNLHNSKSLIQKKIAGWIACRREEDFEAIVQKLIPNEVVAICTVMEQLSYIGWYTDKPNAVINQLFELYNFIKEMYQQWTLQTIENEFLFQNPIFIDHQAQSKVPPLFIQKKLAAIQEFLSHLSQYVCLTGQLIQKMHFSQLKTKDKGQLLFSPLGHADADDSKSNIEFDHIMRYFFVLQKVRGYYVEKRSPNTRIPVVLCPMVYEKDGKKKIKWIFRNRKRSWMIDPTNDADFAKFQTMTFEQFMRAMWSTSPQPSSQAQGQKEIRRSPARQ